MWYLLTHKTSTFSDILSCKCDALPYCRGKNCTFDDINSRLTSVKWSANELNVGLEVFSKNFLILWAKRNLFILFSSESKGRSSIQKHDIFGFMNIAMSMEFSYVQVAVAAAASIGVGVTVIYHILTRSHVKSFKMARSVRCTM